MLRRTGDIAVIGSVNDLNLRTEAYNATTGFPNPVFSFDDV